MRRSRTIRSIVAPIVAFITVSCSKELGPASYSASLVVTAAGDGEFARIIPLTQMRIVVTRGGDESAPVLDVKFDLPTDGSDLVDRDITVEMNEAAEALLFDLMLLNPSDEVMYQTDRLTLNLTSNRTTVLDATMLALAYVGPGVEASSVEITSSSTDVTAGATVQLQAVAKDLQGQAIASTPFAWFTNNAELGGFANPGSGLLSTSPSRGTLSAFARTPTGVQGSTSLVVNPQPDVIEVVSGDGQLAAPGSPLPLPLVVRVNATDGLPISGGDVQFSTQNGVLSENSVVTNLQGLGSVTWTLGPILGLQQTTATVSSAATIQTVTFNATATSLPFGVIDSLINAAIANLEASLNTGVNDFVRAIDPARIDLTALDRFSFAISKQTFQAAYDGAVAPELAMQRQTAAFGVAVSTLAALEDDPRVRTFLTDWDQFALSQNDDIVVGDVTGGTGDMPPTLEEHQALVRDVIQPALNEVSDKLAAVTDPAFVFPLTPLMQGENPTSTPTLELDQTEVLILRAMTEWALAAADIFLAHRAVPSPYTSPGFSSAMQTGSTFLAVNPAESGRFDTARQHLLSAVAFLRQSMDFIQAEVDVQTDDVIIYDPVGPAVECDLAPSGPLFPCQMNGADVQDVKDAMTDLDAMLRGPHTLTTSFGLGEALYDNGFGVLQQDLVVDLSQFFLNPTQDLKTILPAYQTANGELHWMAFAFDEWVIPIPGLNGILPGIMTSDQFKTALDVEDTWSEGRPALDEWVSIASNPVDGTLSAVTRRGNLHSFSLVTSANVDRPDLPVAGTNSSIDLTFDPANQQLFAITGDPLGIWSRVDDDVAAWTLRADPAQLGFQFGFDTHIAASPVSGDFYAVVDGGHVLIPADFSTVTPLPFVPYQTSAFVANTATTELVVLSWDGIVLTRPADLTTLWTQRAVLPFVDFDDRWIGMTQSVLDGSVWVVKTRGDLQRLSVDLLTITDHPDIPATNVVDIVTDLSSDQLVAMTADGRIFTRPDDSQSPGATPWTLRLTLPRHSPPPGACCTPPVRQPARR